MTPADYTALTESLRRKLSSTPGVIGLVALGSMAAADYQPDDYSDHDFFVVTVDDRQEAFRQDLSWLPEHADIAFSWRETAHGLKVLYRSGHLLELAVFSLAELALARVNRFRILLDRGGVAARIAEVRAVTARSVAKGPQDAERLAAQFLFQLLVGAGRATRGETLSGRHFVEDLAVSSFTALVALRRPALEHELLDNLDPLRRFERVYPAVARGIADACAQSPVPAALALLDLVERETPLEGDLVAALDIVRRRIRSFGEPTSDPTGRA